PLAVAFSSAGSSDPEGTTLTYNWTFGDGSSSTTANPSHSYLTPTNYVARLTVSDGTNTSPASVVNVTVLVPGAGLVAGYGFEEGGGTNAADASGYGNTGSLNGGTWTALGKYGGALDFNGTSDLVL